MALLIRELLKDYAHNSIVKHSNEDYLLSKGAGMSWEYLVQWEKHCEFRCDIINTLQYLLDTEQVDKQCIIVLDKYISGYTLSELRIDYPNADEMLIKITALLEYASGYTDGDFVSRMVARYPKYKDVASALHNAMHIAGRTFE